MKASILHPPRAAHRLLRMLGLAALVVVLLCVYLRAYCMGNGQNKCFLGQKNKMFSTYHGEEAVAGISDMQAGATKPTTTPTNLSVNLVMATVLGDDISWTSNLQIPNLQILQYFADGQKKQTPLHPLKNKGREATMYHTYMTDFYDSLPDISIFVHAHEDPWHTEAVLRNSMTYTLNSLDLDEVRRRGYANLRVAWYHACPDWIHTNVSFGAEDGEKTEEPYMWRAFVENFAPDNDSARITVPEVLAQPCCSQFAVTKEAIRTISLREHQKHLDWLLRSEWTDYYSGRTWEHMFQYLFTRRAVDCPVEWKTFCTLYHVCFENNEQIEEVNQLGLARSEQEFHLGFWKELWHPKQSALARQTMSQLEGKMDELRDVARRRWFDEEWRAVHIGDIYS